MEVLLRQVFITSAICAAPMVIMLLLKSWLENHCRAQTLVWISIVIFARSVFVWPFDALPGTGGRLIQTFALVIQAQKQQTSSVAPQPAVTSGGSVDIVNLVFNIWIAGIIVSLLIRFFISLKYFIANHRGRNIVAKLPILDALEQAKHDLGVTAHVDLFMWRGTITPFITGIWSENHTTIYISKFLYDSYKAGTVTVWDFYLIFRHELSHYIAWDHLPKFLITLACSIHWFNPFVYFFAEWTHDNIESARDGMALHGLGSAASNRMNELLLMMLKESNRVRAAKKKKRLIYASPSGHTFSAMKDIRFRMRNMYAEHSKPVNIQFFYGFSVLMALTFMLNCSGLFEQMVDPANWNFPWKTAESSTTIPGGEISFAYPIANPTEIVTPSTFGRNDYSNINRLIFGAELGTNVYAPISGEIIDVDFVGKTPLGNSVTVKDDQIIVVISHLTSYNLSVGDIIKQNQIVGIVDDSGRSIIDGSEILVTDLQGHPVDIVSFLEGNLPIST